MGWRGHPLRAALLTLLADFVWCVFVGFLLGQGVAWCGHLCVAPSLIH